MGVPIPIDVLFYASIFIEYDGFASFVKNTIYLIVFSQFAAFNIAIFIKVDISQKAGLTRDSANNYIFRRKETSQFTTLIKSGMSPLVTSTTSTNISLHFIIVGKREYISRSICIMRKVNPGMNRNKSTIIHKIFT